MDFLTWFVPTAVVVVGLLTGVVAAMGVIAPMIPVRWGMIAAYLASGMVGYVGYWVWLLLALDWNK